MYNCIFTAHCTESICDRSCPILAETSYLLERNKIDMNNPVFSDTSDSVTTVFNFLQESKGVCRITVPAGGSTVSVADLATYCAICQNWQGSQLHCTVYNLRYSKYLDDTKSSWSSGSIPSDLEYVKIWSESAKVLIISNIDYVNFGDFESQTLLNLIQSRATGDKLTVFVCPPLNRLVSKQSRFFEALKQLLSSSKEVVIRK